MGRTNLPHRSYQLALVAGALAACAIVALGACAPETGEGETDSEELIGAPEDITTDDAALAGSPAVGAGLKTTSDLNLRTGPSTSDSVLHVIPSGDVVTVVQSAPS